MRYPSKLKITKGVKNRSEFDLSCDHVSTNDFFRAKVVKSFELVPGDKVRISVENLTRLMPLATPTFGRMDVVTRTFFVPYRTIMQNWNDFIAQVPNTTGSQSHPLGAVTSKVKTIKNSELVNLFLNCYDTVGLTSSPFLMHSVNYDEQTPVPYDVIMYGTTEDSTMYYQFTREGRVLFDLLNSLGYTINWTNPASSLNYAIDEREMSLLPLLAYAKILSDYYQPTQWWNSLQYMLADMCEKNINLNITSHSTISDDFPEFIKQLVKNVCYDADYFTSAWANPVTPTTSTTSNPVIRIDDPTGQQKVVTFTDGDSRVPVIGGTTATGLTSTTPSNFGYISHYALKALDALASFMQRNQVAGYRAIDRYLARYGIKLDNTQANRSLYLGSSSKPVNVTDVTSLADTSNGSTGEVLGGYAGKGLSYTDGKNVHFDSDEFGLLVVLCTIKPHIGYVEGVDACNLHINALDFFTPEYEQLGVQAISNDQLKSDYMDQSDFQKSVVSGSLPPKGVFGWTPRMSEYKFSKDLLTGDFKIHSLNTGLESFHLFRMLKPYWNGHVLATPNWNSFKLSADFLRLDNNQYDRIFTVTDEDTAGDHFFQIFHIECHMSRPMASLTECILDKDDDGKVIEFSGTGSILN